MNTSKSKRTSLSYSTEEDYNAIKLKLTTQDFIVIVEGEDDKKFYSHYLELNKERYLVYAAKFCDFSKGRAVELARKKPELAKTCAIVDADLDRILRTEPQDDNIILTDYHDIEMDILMSQALDKIIGLKVETGLIENLIGTRQNIRDFILSKAKILAQIRHLSIINGWDINFKKLHKKSTNILSFFACGRFENEKDCIIQSLSLKKNSSITYEIIKGDLDNYESYHGSLDLYQLCHGKDTMQIAIYYLNTNLRGKRKEIINTDHIWVAFESNHIKSSNLYGKFQQWLNS